MTINQVMRAILHAKEMAPTREHFWAEAERVIFAYGQAQWDASHDATVAKYRQGVSVDGISYKPQSE